MNRKRNYGVDLFRLVLMFMVCILHTLGHGGILKASVGSPIKSAVFWLLETFVFCAVDSFAFISGYVSNGKYSKFSKLIDMWFQVVFYSFGITIIALILGIGSFNIKELIKGIIPVTSGIYWYFTSYFILFFTIPILNKFFFSLEKDKAKKAFIIIAFLFTILGTVNDPFNTRMGYSGLWLMVLYSLGVLAKKIELFENRSSIQLVCLWIICILVSWGLKQITGSESLIAYVSPTIVLSGMIMVILFSRLKLNQKIISIVSKLSPLAFGIYLFQETPIIRNNLINNSFSFLEKENVIWGFLGVLVIAFIIFTSGLFVEFIRLNLAKFFKISMLSKKIEILFNNILDRINKSGII